MVEVSGNGRHCTALEPTRVEIATLEPTRVEISNLNRIFPPHLVLFLIPYIIMVLVIGLPLWILETGLGQVHQTSGLTVWRRIRPYFTGIGYASTILAFIINSYYIVVLAWVLHYFASAFTGNGELAWGKCGNDWNTKACLKISGGKMAGNVSAMPAKQFFDRNVLQVIPFNSHR